jgi:hypothetical protein
MRTDGCNLERCYVKNNLGGCNNFEALDKVSSICDPNYLAGGIWQHACTLSKATSGQLAIDICFGRIRAGWKRASSDQSGDGLSPREKGGGGFPFIRKSKICETHSFYLADLCWPVWVWDRWVWSRIDAEHKIIWTPNCFYVYFVPLLCNDDVSTTRFIQRLLRWWLSFTYIYRVIKKSLCT